MPSIASKTTYFRARIGRSGCGTDTAIIIRPSNTHTFFNMRAKEIIRRPRG